MTQAPPIHLLKPPEPSCSRRNLVRWQVGFGAFGVPQAAAPIAFALLVLPVTGTADAGAALVFAMTTAQVLSSVPVSRLGTRFNAVRYLRTLLAIRAIALAGVTVLATVRAPFGYLVVAVVAAGSVNGAAYGYQRALLNHLVEPARLPRALGVAATLNEITFALAPVLASLLGTLSPVWAMAAITTLGAGPVLLMPRIRQAQGIRPPELVPIRHRVPTEAWLWLFCAGTSAAVVAAVEIGAVSLALSFDLPPGWAFVFATVLCVGSVSGGLWVSVSNRTPDAREVSLLLAGTAAGSALILLGGHVAMSLAGAAVIGFCLPSLDTFYSLTLDRLAPAHRRAEMFAHLRTADALGLITISGLLALIGLRTAIVASFVLLLTALFLVASQGRFPPAGSDAAGALTLDGRG